MNILTDVLPDHLELDGTLYPVNTDFRDCLRIMMVFESNQIAPQEKEFVLLSNVYYLGTKLPDRELAVKQALWFLNAGQDSEETNGPRVYSFSKDAKMIYAAFRQVHGIDLTTAELHWWQFVALFQAVIANQDNAFGSLVTLRHRLKTGKATKEERAAARDIRDLLDVPDVDTRTLEQREVEARFMRLVEEAERKRREG